MKSNPIIIDLNSTTLNKYAEETKHLVGYSTSTMLRHIKKMIKSGFIVVISKK